MSAATHGRLLLVEDEERLRSLIAVFLKMERYEVVEAEDGVRGVERFLEAGPFDLAIVDLDLPRLPGVEVCRRIRSAAPSQAILVCSAAILAPHFAALDDLGVDRFLTKPYLPTRLLSEIANTMTEPTKGVRATRPGSIDARWHEASAHAPTSSSVPHSLVKSLAAK
jgi:two-component system response regulator RegX3